MASFEEVYNNLVYTLHRNKQLTYRQALLILICLSGIYLLKARDVFILDPSWRKDIQEDYYRNGKFPELNEKLVKPVIFNLDNEGGNELIFVTNDLKLEVYSSIQKLQTKDQQVSRISTLKLLSIISLPFGSKNKSFKQQVLAIKFCDLDARKDKEAAKLFVVLNDFSVLGYNNNLELLWSTSLSASDMKPTAATIFCHSHILYGSITVSKDTHLNTPNQGTTGPPPSLSSLTFAVSTLTGHITWSNWFSTSGQSAYPTTNISSLTKEEVLLLILPHQWSKPSDSYTSTLTVEKASLHLHQSSSAFSSVFGLSHFWAGLPLSSQQFKTAEDERDSPSHFVIHDDFGVRLYNLTSGDLEMAYELANPQAVYLDAEQSGQVMEFGRIPDSLCAVEAKLLQRSNQEVLFSGDICTAPSLFSSASLVASMSGADEELTGTKVVPPLSVPHIPRRKGAFNKLLRKSNPTAQGYDTLFVTSAGRLSSYDPHGHLNWQAITVSKWPLLLQWVDYNHYQGVWEDRADLYKKAFTPSLTPFSLKASDAQPSFVLVTGWNSMSLIDLADGHVLYEHTLPRPPIDDPVITDVDADGYNEIIMNFPFGYVSFQVTQKFNYFYNIAVALVIVLTVVGLSWVCQQTGEPLHRD